MDQRKSDKLSELNDDELDEFYCIKNEFCILLQEGIKQGQCSMWHVMCSISKHLLLHELSKNITDDNVNLGVV